MEIGLCIFKSRVRLKILIENSNKVEEPNKKVQIRLKILMEKFK